MHFCFVKKHIFWLLYIRNENAKCKQKNETFYQSTSGSHNTKRCKRRQLRLRRQVSTSHQQQRMNVFVTITLQRRWTRSERCCYFKIWQKNSNGRDSGDQYMYFHIICKDTRKLKL